MFLIQVSLIGPVTVRNIGNATELLMSSHLTSEEDKCELEAIEENNVDVTEPTTEFQKEDQDEHDPDQDTLREA